MDPRLPKARCLDRYFFNYSLILFVKLFILLGDDFQLYSSGCYNSDVSFCILRLNGDLENVYRWSLDNGLVLNGSKTQAIIFSRIVGPFSSGGDTGWRGDCLQLGPNVHLYHSIKTKRTFC
jgi:hypothetical protein